VFPARRLPLPTTRHIRLAPLGWALLLCACDVQVQDTTPSAYPADHGIGMYELSARVSSDSLVTPRSVVLFAISDGKKLTLTPDDSYVHYRGLYSVRCRDSFPLQLLAVWRLQGLTTAHKLIPSQPRRIKLTEPPLTQAVSFDSSGAVPKGGWQGGVRYRFVTTPSVQITAAHIEPSSAARADVAAAQAISVVTSFPVVADCGDLAEVRLASTAPQAHGILFIDTDHPGVPHWQTTVEFSPK
jgi:hypothetical protein